MIHAFVGQITGAAAGRAAQGGLPALPSRGCGPPARPAAHVCPPARSQQCRAGAGGSLAPGAAEAPGPGIPLPGRLSSWAPPAHTAADPAPVLAPAAAAAGAPAAAAAPWPEAPCGPPLGAQSALVAAARSGPLPPLSRPGVLRQLTGPWQGHQGLALLCCLAAQGVARHRARARLTAAAAAGEDRGALAPSSPDVLGELPSDGPGDGPLLAEAHGSASSPALALAESPASATTAVSAGPRRSLWGLFSEPIAARHPQSYSASLMNRDFMPTLASERILGTWDIVSLWIGLVVGVPTWYLAGSLVEMGMSWWQGIATVFLGNVLVLLPMLLNGHPGCKYGIPFPVLSRAAFGVYGANIPSLLRGLVACGWFGIQTWIGGQAIAQLAGRVLALGQAQGLPGAAVLAQWGQAQVEVLAISVLDLGSFMSFWLVQLAIVWNGIESIKVLEAYSAPILISLCLALLVWAYLAAGGFGPMLSAPSQFSPGQPKHGHFWGSFFPALTANIGFWATLSLNIPDFTRFARSQRVQVVGQMLGLPPFMAAFSFVGLAVTSATTVIFGQVISDPIALLGRLEGTLPSLLSVIGLVLATLTTNIAANVVAPANALVNLAPAFFSFRRAGLLTAILGVLMAPWRLVQSSDDFVFRWLIGYSALLGPVAGVAVADYFLVRGCELDIDSLFSAAPTSLYWYTGGFNMCSIAALAAGILPNIPGFLQALGAVSSVPAWCKTLYGSAWIVGFGISALVYWVLMTTTPEGKSSMMPTKLDGASA